MSEDEARLRFGGLAALVAVLHDRGEVHSGHGRGEGTAAVGAEQHQVSHFGEVPVAVARLDELLAIDLHPLLGSALGVGEGLDRPHHPALEIQPLLEPSLDEVALELELPPGAEDRCRAGLCQAWLHGIVPEPLTITILEVVDDLEEELRHLRRPVTELVHGRHLGGEQNAVCEQEPLLERLCAHALNARHVERGGAYDAHLL